MRTLIVDNYDSFTYNLVHYVAEVTGCEPTVILNDTPEWSLAELSRFDCVILSPGPGRPDRPVDFGWCTEIIRAAQLPVLGVCLGHQGICYFHGGDVIFAPEAYHGRVSEVVHDGRELFDDIPSPFDVVRYHSLVTDRLPTGIEPIGWTPDGVVMAVRHRSLPQWGVQFHPESIRSEHGHKLLANFVRLAERWNQKHRPHPSDAGPDRASETNDLATQPKPQLGLHHRVFDLDLAPEQVYDKLYRDSEHAFWLDSSQYDAERGRFSFMGDASGPLARTVEADVSTGTITVVDDHGVETVHDSFFDWLDADIRAHRVVTRNLPFDFALGWVGYLGYELKAECGGERVYDSSYPDAAFIFADRAIAFDHQERQIHLLALSGTKHDDEMLRWLQHTAARLYQLTAESPSPEYSGAITALGPPELRHDRQAYLERIEECQNEIHSGETYEVCLTNMISASGELDVWQGYRKLRNANPAPFAALLRLGSLSVLSCSPERFLRVTASGQIESKPIKGTRPRSDEVEEDERLRRDLMENIKDHAENLMIVDLVRNDLSTCAEVCTVRVPKLFNVESYATVHQLVSTVQAQLRPNKSAVDCARAAFPGGSMTGAPKIRTMQIIDRLEDGPRGVYSGALGYFSLNGATDLSIVIRTVVAQPSGVEFGVGGAIVALSDPVAEYEETGVKATPLLRLVGEERMERDSEEAAAVEGPL
ncbi:aminodeoxychorismate synthase component I [Actinopolyspora mortivallis]|uniref:aminodeoxychorismate synthase component I n=1 Tax=Actinopolyspora mortivallis TaxID=33906 RepID=UPI00039C1C26|nr:aminodeoxychorismate synthase component I [Actinopolyspora mortivallis]